MLVWPIQSPSSKFEPTNSDGQRRLMGEMRVPKNLSLTTRSTSIIGTGPEGGGGKPGAPPTPGGGVGAPWPPGGAICAPGIWGGAGDGAVWDTGDWGGGTAVPVGVVPGAEVGPCIPSLASFTGTCTVSKRA